MDDESPNKFDKYHAYGKFDDEAQRDLANSENNTSLSDLLTDKLNAEEPTSFVQKISGFDTPNLKQKYDELSMRQQHAIGMALLWTVSTNKGPKRFSAHDITDKIAKGLLQNSTFRLGQKDIALFKRVAEVTQTFIDNHPDGIEAEWFNKENYGTHFSQTLSIMILNEQDNSSIPNDQIYDRLTKLLGNGPPDLPKDVKRTRKTLSIAVEMVRLLHLSGDKFSNEGMLNVTIYEALVSHIHKPDEEDARRFRRAAEITQLFLNDPQYTISDDFFATQQSASHFLQQLDVMMSGEERAGRPVPDNEVYSHLKTLLSKNSPGKDNGTIRGM